MKLQGDVKMYSVVLFLHENVKVEYIMDNTVPLSCFVDAVKHAVKQAASLISEKFGLAAA